MRFPRFLTGLMVALLAIPAFAADVVPYAPTAPTVGVNVTATAPDTSTLTRPAQGVVLINPDTGAAYSTGQYTRPDEASGTLVPSTSAYAAGQPIGGLITVDISAAVGSSMANQWIAVGSVLVVARSDTAPTNQTLAPIIFDENPSASTFTDRTNTSLAAADYAKVIIWTSASASGGSNVILNALSWRTDYTTRQSILVQCDANGRIYLALPVGGAITFGANPNLIWRVQFGY